MCIRDRENIIIDLSIQNGKIPKDIFTRKSLLYVSAVTLSQIEVFRRNHLNRLAESIKTKRSILTFLKKDFYRYVYPIKFTVLKIFYSTSCQVFYVIIWGVTHFSFDFRFDLGLFLLFNFAISLWSNFVSSFLIFVFSYSK